MSINLNLNQNEGNKYLEGMSNSQLTSIILEKINSRKDITDEDKQFLEIFFQKSELTKEDLLNSLEIFSEESSVDIKRRIELLKYIFQEREFLKSFQNQINEIPGAIKENIKSGAKKEQQTSSIAAESLLIDGEKNFKI